MIRRSPDVGALERRQIGVRWQRSGRDTRVHRDGVELSEIDAGMIRGDVVMIIAFVACGGVTGLERGEWRRHDTMLELLP